MKVHKLASPATMGVRGRFEARRLLSLALLVAGCGADADGCASHSTFVANNLASSLYAGETTAASTADCCEACDGSSYECLAVEYKASTGACWFLYADWSFYLSASTAQSSGWEGCLRSDGVAVSKDVDSSGAALVADGAASLEACADLC